MSSTDQIKLNAHTIEPHVEDSFSDANNVTEAKIEANYELAAQQTLAAGDKTWSVLTRNPRMLCFMGAVLLNGIICGMHPFIQRPQRWKSHTSAGIELNMSGNMLGLQAFCRQMGSYDAATKTYAVDPGYVSAWTGFGWPGQITGMIASGFLADMFGRRFVMWSIVAVTPFSALLEVTAKNWIGWGFAKLIMGMATGVMQAGVSTYIGEVAPREIRGIALGMFNMLMNLGNLIATIVAWAAQKRWPDPLDNKQYKVPLYIMLALPIVESPNWLHMHNQPTNAKKSLKFMYPYFLDEDLTLELAKIQYTLEKSAAIVQATGFAANVAIFFLIENPRLGGRWKILFGGLTLETLGMRTSIWNCLPLWQNADSVYSGHRDRWVHLVRSRRQHHRSNHLIAATIIGNIGSVTGPGAAGWAYTGESGSARLRTKTTTLGNLGNCMMMNASGVYAPYLLSTVAYAKWGEKTGFFFGSLGLVSLILVYFLIPDYTGRSDAQIDELFVRRIPARKFQSTECTGDYGRDLLAEHAGV
ncbi:hypothetical protein PV11_02309 [Exophiala sideris]|uniref:Major facilitator superfamily (MFS) profile domain-containing protein n=1 Tax=Exophiala sideris TaxID=1016849 RepID=A0A0D1XF37_9EURO|nr:hypothetical protein PV11_02309 [Exophiala sideris]